MLRSLPGLIGILSSILAISPTGSAQCLTQSFGASSALTFGRDISAGPERVLVGAYHAIVQTGTAYVFVRAPGGYVQEAELFASSGSPSDGFGGHVALTGSDAFISATLGSAGSVYVFRRLGTSWNEIQVLAPSPAVAGFGTAIAVDGDRALISAPVSQQVFVFERTGAAWNEVGVMTPSGLPFGEEFGTALALAGERAVIGSGFASTSGPFSGTAWIFERSGGAWIEIVELAGTNTSSFDFFGAAVAVNEAGTAVIVARNGDGVVPDAGSAHVFAPGPSGAWTESQILSDPNGDPSDFWNSADLDGDRLVIGDVDGETVYVFERNSTGSFVLAGQSAQAGFADSVDQVDGAVFVGDPTANGGMGAVHTFLVDGEDCNGNGIPDACDILSGVASDADGDGVPDVCPCPVQRYCVAGLNSTGAGATISLDLGGQSLSANAAVLEAAPVPNQPGIFVYSDTQVQVAFGEGFRCVGGTVVRIFPPSVSTHGVLSRTIDWGALPGGAIAPGQTWSFQAWYRDPTGGPSGFNLSDGIEVTFCP